MLHSSDKTRVLEEAVRLLKPGGDFIFTEPMVADECPASVLDPILERAHLESMASPGFYRSEIGRMGLEETDFEDHSSQVATHYTRVRQELERREEEFSGLMSREYITQMKTGLDHWVEGANNGYVFWGIFHFRA